MRISRQHFENWSEWELVKHAKPRFDGHYQPKVPAWGYTDEKDPKVMEQKIQAASTHGSMCLFSIGIPMRGNLF